MDRKSKPKSQQRLQTLAEFRYALRQFLHFSEEASAAAGLQPQQHQLLLQLAGAQEGTATTVSYAAERLGLRHNSVVELSQRCEDAGLIRKKQNLLDRRCVVLEVTPEGERVLRALTEDHARELHVLVPRLLRTLTQIRSIESKADDSQTKEKIRREKR